MSAPARYPLRVRARVAIHALRGRSTVAFTTQVNGAYVGGNLLFSNNSITAGAPGDALHIDHREAGA